MKFFVAVFAALAATALADKAKPSPVFNAADKKATGLEKKAPVTADKRSDAPAADEYGSPAAPAQAGLILCTRKQNHNHKFLPFHNSGVFWHNFLNRQLFSLKSRHRLKHNGAEDIWGPIN